MCTTCFNRGYSDYPKWVGSSSHPDSYRQGWERRKAEVGGKGKSAPDMEFCRKCYDRGREDGRSRTWAPPERHGGHYESYRKGFEELE